MSFQGKHLIRTFEDLDRLAPEKGPKRFIVLAPEDEEFMLAVKHSWQRGYIEPVLIGSRDKIERLAGQVELDISPFEKIFESDRQGIANLGVSMLFSGDVDMTGKGQIPTAFIYRSIIREESKVRKGTMVSVISLWDIAGLGHLTSLADTGGEPADPGTRRAFLRGAKYAPKDLQRKLVGQGGLAAYLGTTDAIAIESAIDKGDEKSTYIYQAMVYQIAKDIGAMATVLSGQVDGIVLTGGLAHSKRLVGWVTERVQFLASVFLYPGEDEMAALAEGALRVLLGQEEVIRPHQ